MFIPRLKTYYICFPGGRTKCLTMSYDDGRKEDLRFVPLLNQYGIKGTFHLNSGRQDDERRLPVSMYPELYKGHEVSAHSYSHPTIARCPITQVVQQILEDRRDLERLMGYPIRGMSYPNGSYSKEIVDILPSLGIRYSRTIGETQAFDIPENFLTWDSTCHHNHNLLSLADQFLDIDQPQYLKLMYVWGHSFEFTKDNNWELIETFCEKMGNHDEIWYATNIQIVDYMAAAKALVFTADGDRVYNPSAISVWISVDGTIHEIKGGELAELY